jgi:hypothetical protein
MLRKESATVILKVLVYSILHWMLVDPEMHACTSHVIFTRDIIYLGLIGRNTSGWRLANFSYKEAKISWCHSTF